MFNSARNRLVAAIADAFEFREAIALSTQQGRFDTTLKGKQPLIAAQFTTLRTRITDAAKACGNVLQLPYDEAQLEVMHRKQQRRIAFENKKRARELEEELEAIGAQ